MGASAGRHCSVPLLGCHCSVPLLGAIAGVPLLGAIVGCHGWMPLLVPLLRAIARNHCEKKIDQSVTPFSAALFSALITHKNWLVLSGVYAGIIQAKGDPRGDISSLNVLCLCYFIQSLQ